MNVLSYVIHNSLSPKSHDMGSAPLGVNLQCLKLDEILFARFLSRINDG